MPVWLICQVCSSQFSRTPSEVKRSHRLGREIYCSHRCQWRAWDSSTAERFWTKVDKESCLGDICGCHKGLGCCWGWIACLNDNGYGEFHYKGAAYLAHRVSYALMNNLDIETLTAEIKVLHMCDVPRCVRHLFTGTQRDNIRDAMQKGRIKRVSRLTVPEVQQIRALQGIVLQAVIAEQFKISKTMVSLIQNRKLLKGIP